MQKKIFVTSTVYDLIDIRSEVEVLLREMGFVPILSDSLTADFTVEPDKNSIESCLTNVRSSDYLIVILSKRYGPSLFKVDYGNLSATQLEYNEAKSARIPILFYVRDRLESDYRIWKKNEGKNDVELSWIEAKDRGLLTFLDEHQKLDRQLESSNWFQTFANSIELKGLIRRDLRFPAAENELREAIKANKIPMMFGAVTIDTIPVSIEFEVVDRPTHRITCTFTNCGSVPAYNVNLWFADGKQGERESVTLAIPPNQKIDQIILYTHKGIKNKLKRILIVRYQTSEGHTVEDHFNLSLEINADGTCRYSLLLVDKLYQIGDDLSFKIINQRQA